MYAICEVHPLERTRGAKPGNKTRRNYSNTPSPFTDLHPRGNDRELVAADANQEPYSGELIVLVTREVWTHSKFQLNAPIHRLRVHAPPG